METPNENKSDKNTRLNRIEELLTGQADALIAGISFEPQFEKLNLTSKQVTETRDLIRIAQHLNETMTPAEPSSEFMSRLKNELTGQAPVTLLVRWRKLPASYQLAAKLGGLTLGAGLVFLAAARGLSSLQRKDDSKVEPVLNSAG